MRLGDLFVRWSDSCPFVVGRIDSDWIHIVSDDDRGESYKVKLVPDLLFDGRPFYMSHDEKLFVYWP